MASSSAPSFGTTGGKGTSDTVTMQVADTTTTDDNDEDGETLMRVTTVGAEAIPYFLGAVVDHNPSSVAEEIEVETSASLVEDDEDVNLEQKESEKSEQDDKQQQDDIVKYACDLAAVRESPPPKICEKLGSSEITEGSGGFTVKIMCGGGSSGDSEEASGDKDDGDRMDVDEENRKEVELKAATTTKTTTPVLSRVSCIQWASSAKRKGEDGGGEGGGRRDCVGASSIPSTSSTTTTALVQVKTSCLPSSPVFLKDEEWGGDGGGSGNEESEGMADDDVDVQQVDDRMREGISNTSYVEGEGGRGPASPPSSIQTNVGPRPMSQSQLQGSVTSLLTALKNPVGNAMLPCCCCVHPCCIVMRELFSSCFPLWSNQAQSRQICCPTNPTLPQRRPPPPGFEDPPETEWITANVNHIDPSGSLRYKCRNCDGLVEYRSRRQKAFHLNFTRLRFECKKCHRRYLTNKQLVMHSTRHNEKTRICSFCDKRFLTQIELQNHLNTHTKARPYRCPICFRRFNQTTRYYAHVRDFHKKYDCHDCYHSKVCAANSTQRGYRRLGNQGSPKPSTSAGSLL